MRFLKRIPPKSLHLPKRFCAKFKTACFEFLNMEKQFWKRVGESLLSVFSKKEKVFWKGDHLVVGTSTPFEKRRLVEDFLKRSSSNLERCRLGFMFLVDLIVFNSKQGFVSKDQFWAFLQRYALYVKREKLIDSMRMSPRYTEELKLELADITFKKE